MRVERHSYGFGVSEHFPNARRVRACECSWAYKADRDGKPFLIIDSGTMADFLDEGSTDRELLNGLVSVIEFDSDEERETYIARDMASWVDVENHPLFRAHAIRVQPYLSRLSSHSLTASFMPALASV